MFTTLRSILNAHMICNTTSEHGQGQDDDIVTGLTSYELLQQLDVEYRGLTMDCQNFAKIPAGFDEKMEIALQDAKKLLTVVQWEPSLW